MEPIRNKKTAKRRYPEGREEFRDRSTHASRRDARDMKILNAISALESTRLRASFTPTAPTDNI